MSRRTCRSAAPSMHAGINPTYRGQMGGYWSLVEEDAANFGATLHLVDAGTDTGGTLYEVRTLPDDGDFIATYPLVLTVAAIDITLQSVDDAVHGRLRPSQPEGRRCCAIRRPCGPGLSTAFGARSGNSRATSLFAPCDVVASAVHRFRPVHCDERGV